MRTAKVLFWLGILAMVAGVYGNVYTYVHAVAIHAVGYNAGVFIVPLFSSIGQGGLLIGVAKIIEVVSSRHA